MFLDNLSFSVFGTGLFGVMDIDPSYKRPAEPRMRHPEWLNEVYKKLKKKNKNLNL